jgi:site-specific DNA-methyltransferase (adenine-specific)
MINLLHGDCLEQMKTLDDNSVDSIVSDPPYGISFMAKKWDYDVPSVEVWEEAMRVLKPGGHALIACGTRTQHRMVVNIEDAGFEIRDVVSWIYGSGFPKSLNISKAIDKAAGAEREVTGYKKLNEKDKKTYIPNGKDQMFEGLVQGDKKMQITAPATEAAKQWDGWGTALKPACEFFTLCRKPLSEKTIAANVLKWGTGGINIDGCRVEGVKEGDPMRFTKSKRSTERSFGKGGSDGDKGMFDPDKPIGVEVKQDGRFPANLIHDGSQEVLELFPETKSGGGLRHNKNNSKNNAFGKFAPNVSSGGGDSGSAARFFYCAKASKKDRNEGLPTMSENHESSEKVGNTHPTVKPTALMAYLCRLITPTGGVVLDPYMGSGSTGKAAVREGFSFVGCELDKDYFDIATARVNNEDD